VSNPRYPASSDREIHGIRATFLNNIGVGMFITGFAVPYFAFAAKNAETGATFLRAFTPDETKTSLAGLVVMFFAFVFAQFFRGRAVKILEELED
jgi:hypothetical protein